MTNDPITPARLRELANNAFDTEFCVLQAALRAAADQLVAERETNGATALLLQQARNALAAREALLRRAGEALGPFAKTGELFDRLPFPYDMAVYKPAAGPEYTLTDRHLRRARALTATLAAREELLRRAGKYLVADVDARARALAAEIAAALGGD